MGSQVDYIIILNMHVSLKNDVLLKSDWLIRQSRFQSASFALIWFIIELG